MADNNYDYPTETPLIDGDGFISATWGQWVNRTHNNAKTLQQSGVTADRPTSVLWIGRFYFDTSLNKPIWIKQVKPTVLWCDATGATV
jgi:hypothetical protein